MCATLDFIDTSSLGLETGEGRYRPGICGYCSDDASFTKRGKLRSSLSNAELFIDVNPCDHEDPFRDPPNGLHNQEEIEEHEFIKISKTNQTTDSRNGDTFPKIDAKTVLGRNVAFATELFARQQRIFCFSIFIIGSTARLLRWDRSGAVISQEFDYKERPEHLCEFLRRFDIASPEERGHDPSVTTASRDEERLFAKQIHEEVAFQLDLDEELDKTKLDEAMGEHYSQGRVMKMEVYNHRLNEYEQFLISRPVQSPTSAAGRATRGYWSVKVDGVDAHKVFFIKDTWRTTDEALRREEDAYEELNDDENRVMNVGTMYCGGPQMVVRCISDDRVNVLVGNSTVDIPMDHQILTIHLGGGPGE